MPTQEVKPETADLYFREGTSDKEYHLQLITDPPSQEKDSWTVKAQWGKHDSDLRDEVKIEGATFDEAKKMYDKTLKAKLKKGYLLEA